MNDDDIKKHRRDVLMAVSSLPVGEQYQVGESIRKTLDDFLLGIEEASIKQSLKASLGINEEQLNELLNVLKDGFIL